MTKLRGYRQAFLMLVAYRGFSVILFAPVAALGAGWPSFAGVMSPRLGLDVTIHRDRYDESGLEEKIAAYDKRREAAPEAGDRRNVMLGWADRSVSLGRVCVGHTDSPRSLSAGVGRGLPRRLAPVRTTSR